MCLVEEKKSSKPVLACATIIVNGMHVYTYSNMIKKSREGIIEFFLLNHPLDCPICDQSGECDLQDQTIIFGADKSRFYESHKRAVENKNYSPLIKFMLNRCIHCSRCVRFLNEVGENYSLSLLGRGSSMEIGTFTDNMHYNTLSGNIIDLCPVGALTSKPYAFLARPWELIDLKFIDIFDTTMSKIKINFRGLNVVRILPFVSEKLNEEWITDKIRFSYDAYNLQRLVAPVFIFNNQFFYCSWKNLLFCFKKFYLNNLKFLYYSNKNSNFNVFIGKFVDISSIVYLNKFLKSQFDVINLLFDFKIDSKNFNDFRMFYLSKQNINLYNKIYLVNCNLRYENPIINLELKRFLANKSNFFYYFGYLYNFNFNNIGHNFYNFYKNYLFNEKILCLLSSNNLNLIDYFILVTEFFSKTRIILLNTLNISTIFLDELNIFTKKFFLRENFLIFNFSYDDFYKKFYNFSKQNCVIYQGSHGEYGASKSNIVFPSTFFFEKKPHISVNLLGSMIDIYDTFYKYSLVNIKDDWKIFKIKSEILFNKKLHINIIKYFDFITPNYFKKLFYFNPKNNFNFVFNKINFFIQNKFSFIFINNYFSSDIISRLSPIFLLSSVKFNVTNDFVWLKKY